MSPRMRARLVQMVEGRQFLLPAHQTMSRILRYRQALSMNYQGNNCVWLKAMAITETLNWVVIQLR